MKDKQKRPEEQTFVESLTASSSDKSGSSLFGDSGGGQEPAKTLLGGHFQLIRQVGAGGMSTVFEAEDIKLHRRVAIKLLAPKLQKDKESLLRFNVEATATSRLNHENIVKVFESGLHEGQPYIAMEYIEGESLSNFLQQKRTLSIPETLPIIEQICDALEEAHLHKVVHRDLKPSNIMIVATQPVKIKIVDFGIARIISDTSGQALTKTGDVIGSPLYMSPEQCAGKHVDKRSDIYSLGCIFYECLTGQPPHLGNDAIATIMKHYHDQPLSLKEATLGGEFPLELERIVAKMLAKNPDHRYRCVEELNYDLKALKVANTTSENPWAHGAAPAGVDFFNDLRLAKMRNLQAIDLSMFDDAKKESNGAGINKNAWVIVGVCLVAVAAVAIALAFFPRSETSAIQRPSNASATQNVKTAEVINGAPADILADAEKKAEINAEKQGDTKFEQLLHADASRAYVTFYHTACSPPQWSRLSRFTKLRQIDLSGSNVTPAGILALQAAPLEIMYFDERLRIREHLKGLQTMSHLKRLSLNRDDIYDADLDLLSANIEELDLSQNQNVSDKGIAKLLRLHALRWLSLCDNRQLTVSGLMQLQALKGLRHLALGGIYIDRKGMNRLQASMPGCLIDYKGSANFDVRNDRAEDE